MPVKADFFNRVDAYRLYLIKRELYYCHGNQSLAARNLEMSIGSLRKWMHVFGVSSTSGYLDNLDGFHDPWIRAEAKDQPRTR